MAEVQAQVLRQILGRIQLATAETQPVPEIGLAAADLGLSTEELVEAIDHLLTTGLIEVESRNTLEDGILLKQVNMAAAGQAYLQQLPESADQGLQTDPSDLSGTAVLPFLEQVRQQAGLEDVYDARDITEVVFRTMRDLMSNEASDRVAEELTVQALPTDDQALGKQVSVLWRDTNPLVALLSRIRQPLVIKPETFLFRVQQEAGLQRGISSERVVSAVFSATKAELSEDRIQEIGTCLPGEIRQLWERA